MSGSSDCVRVAVVSTMTGWPWGGSDELWAAMAHRALDDHARLLVIRCPWQTEQSQIQVLRRRGAEVAYIDPVGVGRRFKARRSASAVVQRFKPRRSTSAVVQRRRAASAVVQRFKPDVVVFSHGGTFDILYQPAFAAIVPWLRSSGCPYVVVSQLTRDEPRFSDAHRERASSYFAGASAAVFVSEANLVSTERQIATSLPHARILCNPLNLRDYSPVEWHSAGLARMACVARLDVEYKGQDLLFEALSSTEWAGRAWELALFGSGQDERYLRRLASHFAIADRVRFMGHVADVRSIWRQSHVLVMPSRAEGTPLALIEAMLCARPSVVTDVGGNADWVSEPDTGFVAPAPSAAAVRSALERCWTARQEWRAIGARAHVMASGRYDRAAGATLFQTVLAVVDEKGRRRSGGGDDPSSG